MTSRPLVQAAWIALLAFCVPLADAHSGQDFRRKLEDLIIAAEGNRSPGSPGNLKALAFLKAEAKKLPGWEISEHSFTPDIDFAVKSYNDDFKRLIASQYKPDHPEFLKWRKFTDNAVQYMESLRSLKGTNLVLSKKGTDPKLASEVMIVGAHFDTITHDLKEMKPLPAAPAPGADDNGTGVITLLTLASNMKDLKPTRTLELIFFDFEEAFYLGSRAYARMLKEKALKAQLVNLEMIGWDQPEAGRVKIYCRSKDQPGGVGDHQVAQKISAVFLKNGLKAEVLGNNFDRSDNWPFWAFGHTAVTISQDWERNFNRTHYHSPEDRADHVNYYFVDLIGTATERFVREQLK
jgi:hypothetical protein